MDEAKITARLKKGDPAALVQVIEQYTPYLYTIVVNILGSAFSPEDAEDIISESFTVLWYSREKIQRGRLKAYLSAIARNKAISHLRKLKLYEPLEDDMLIVRCRQPEQELILGELTELARKAVDSLPEPDREIFKRHYFLYQKTEDIAFELKLNPATVRTKLTRGRKRLKKHLTERGYGCENLLD